MEDKDKKITFLLADDHSIIRQGLELLIKDEFMNAEVLHASDIDSVIKIVEKEKINFIVLDINFPDGSSLSAVSKILEINPTIKILIFSAFDENLYALRYIKAGAVGYLNKLSDEDEIKQAILNIVIRGKHISQKIQEQILDSYVNKKPINPLDLLSDRELEIATLLVKGYGNLEISAKLDIKQNTISTLKNRVYQKLDISNLPELIDIFNVYLEE